MKWITIIFIIINYFHVKCNVFSSSKTTSPENTPSCTSQFEAIMLGIGRTSNSRLELCVPAKQPYDHMITFLEAGLINCPTN